MSGRITVIVFAVFFIWLIGVPINAYIVHFSEFEPAHKEWDAANARGDRAAMLDAFAKELDAHSRTINPFWPIHLFSR